MPCGPMCSEVADGVEDSGASGRHLIGVQPWFPEEPKYASSVDSGQELALWIRPEIVVAGLQ